MRDVTAIYLAAGRLIPVSIRRRIILSIQVRSATLRLEERDAGAIPGDGGGIQPGRLAPAVSVTQVSGDQVRV